MIYRGILKRSMPFSKMTDNLPLGPALSILEKQQKYVNFPFPTLKFNLGIKIT